MLGLRAKEPRPGDGVKSGDGGPLLLDDFFFSKRASKEVTLSCLLSSWAAPDLINIVRLVSFRQYDAQMTYMLVGVQGRWCVGIKEGDV